MNRFIHTFSSVIYQESEINDKVRRKYNVNRVRKFWKLSANNQLNKNCETDDSDKNGGGDKESPAKGVFSELLVETHYSPPLFRVMPMDYSGVCAKAYLI